MGNRPGHYNAKRDILLERTHYICHYCKVKMIPTVKGKNSQRMRPNTATVDHVVPFGMCKDTAFYNMVPCCYKCNNDFGEQVYKCFCRFCQSARATIELKQLTLGLVA